MYHTLASSSSEFIYVPEIKRKCDAYITFINIEFHTAFLYNFWALSHGESCQVVVLYYGAVKG